MKKKVYLDNASTTPLCEAAKKAIILNMDDYYNPSSSYEDARKVKIKIEEAREQIAQLIGAESADTIYFTSGASEANSWVCDNFRTFKSRIEHHSLGCAIDYFDLKKDNSILLDGLDDLYAGDVISCGYVNNETGIIQNVKDLEAVIHYNALRFHTDATQALPHLKVNVQDFGVDLLSASAHKFNGQKGCGFLYAKNAWLNPIIQGGKQERGRRGGTENVLGILAMAAALQDTIDNMEEINAKTSTLFEKLRTNLADITGVKENVDYSNINTVNSILNVRIDGVSGADVVAMADEFGVCISAGSACNEGNAEPSHVLTAIGLTKEEALSSIRISIGRYNTKEDIDYASRVLNHVIKTLRSSKGV